MTGFDPPTTWTDRILDQLRFHWSHQLRPGLDGLTDEEWHWEPVPGCWGVRPVAEASVTFGGDPITMNGAVTPEFAWPEPENPPVTTIAWRTIHMAEVLEERNVHHWLQGDFSRLTKTYPDGAAAGLAELDTQYSQWVAGLEALGDDGLAQPVGPKEGPFANHSYADLALHVHREIVHHGAEVLCLRSLYRASGGRTLS